MAVRQTFSGRALRARRKQLKLSRDALGWAVGRTYSSITNYERGVTTPSGEVIARLAETLECSPNDLFEKNGHGA
jgi:transcriptional regulator with XRE-family HTH domain